MGHMCNLLGYNYLTGVAVVHILFIGNSFHIMEQIDNYDCLRGMSTQRSWS